MDICGEEKKKKRRRRRKRRKDLCILPFARFSRTRNRQAITSCAARPRTLYARIWRKIQIQKGCTVKNLITMVSYRPFNPRFAVYDNPTSSLQVFCIASFDSRRQSLSYHHSPASHISFLSIYFSNNTMILVHHVILQSS